MRTDEQHLHDRINLPTFVKHLERAIQDSDWAPPKRETWIRAQGTLQQLRHARFLLDRVQRDHVDPTPAQERRYAHYNTTLDRLEAYMHQVEQQLTPPIRRPKPLLPSIRPPPPKPTSPIERSPSLSVPDVHDLLPASPDPQPSLPSAPTTSKISATPTILQNSRALHQDLSEQLAQMATQLRRNATHFSESLEKDKSVVVAMQEKVEGNFEFMKRERIRLRDFRGKSGGTTCLVILSIVVVLIAFILMVFIIRLT